MSKLDDIVKSGVSIDVKENTDCYVDGSCSAIIDMPQIKQQIKALMLEMIGEDHDARQVDRGNEAYNPNSEDYIYGYNLAQSIIRKKVSEL